MPYVDGTIIGALMARPFLWRRDDVLQETHRAEGVDAASSRLWHGTKPC